MKLKFLFLLFVCLTSVCCTGEKGQISRFVIFTNVTDDWFIGGHVLGVFEKDNGYNKLIRVYKSKLRHFNEEDSTYHVNFSSGGFFAPYKLDDKHDYRIILCDSLKFDITGIILRDTTYRTYDSKNKQYILKTIKILKSYHVNGNQVTADNPDNAFGKTFHIPMEFAAPVKEKERIIRE